MALGPVVASAGLAEDKVVGPEELASKKRFVIAGKEQTKGKTYNEIRIENAQAPKNGPNGPARTESIVPGSRSIKMARGT